MFAARTGGSGISVDEVAHLWQSYLPGQYNDPHGHLWRSYGIRSRVLAAEYVDNGLPVPEGTRWTRRHPLPTTGAAGGPSSRAISRARTTLTWQRFLRQAPRWMPSGDGVVLHAHFGTTAARAVPIMRRCRVPVVVTLYGVDASAVLRVRAWQERYRRMFVHADVIVVLCSEVVKRLVDLGCPSEKIVVWRMPAGIEDFPFREPSRSSQIRLLIAARFVEKKGYPVLLDAFADLVSEGRDVTLTMIGYGPQRAALEERVAAAGLMNRVTVVDTALGPGFHRVFSRALDDADIFVLPSIMASDGDDEGGPSLTLVCAQAAGIPVVCTPFPGSELSVVDGQTGLYADSGDAASLAGRLRSLIDRPADRRAIGRAASQHVGPLFSLDGQLEELVGFYRRAAESHR